LPPTVQKAALVGSGGQKKPCSARAVCKAWLVTPGCTTARRLGEDHRRGQGLATAVVVAVGEAVGGVQVEARLAHRFGEIPQEGVGGRARHGAGGAGVASSVAGASKAAAS